MHRIFSNRRLLFLAIILIFSNIVITGISMFIIYNKSISTLEISLMDIVERQKSLVTTLQEQGKSEKEIIEFIKSMRQKYYGIGQKGEFAIAQRKGDSANFLLSVSGQSMYYINNAENHGLPMRLAFKNKQGVVKGEDYNGIKVLAAYSYIPSLKWGIVAKIPLSEVEEPYLNAFLIAILIFTALLSLSIFLFIKISNPIIKGIIASEEKFRRAIQLAPFPIMIHAEDGEVLNISQGWTDITGYSLSEIPTIEKWTELAYGVSRLNIKEYIETLYSIEGSKNEGEYAVTCHNNTTRTWDFSSAPLGKLSDGRRAVISMAKDVTERKQIENEREITIKLLGLINQNNDMHKLISTVAEFLHNWTGCEAVGIRLREGDDYPYYETLGFPDDFVQKEKHLCAIDLKGQIVRDETGNPVLECICGNVLCSRFDPSKSFFTAKGTFWTNCLTSLLAGMPEADQQSYTRNLCNGAGYESVALFPLRNGTETFGLIQLNDKRAGQFTPELIALIERLSDSISLALYQRRTQKVLAESEERFKMLFDKAPLCYQSLNSDGCFIEVNETWLETLGYQKEEVIGKWFGDFLAPEYTNAFMERFPLFKSLGIIHSEFEMLKKDGTRIFAAFDGRIGHTESGDFKQTHCVLNDITQRKQAEKELISAKEKAEESEKKYKSLFTNMMNAFGLHEMIFNEKGEPIDYVFLEVNPIWEKVVGIKAKNVINKSVREIMPSIEQTWIERYGRIVLTGIPEEFVDYNAATQKYYNVFAYKHVGNKFAVVFNDITDKKRFESELIKAKEKAEESDTLKTAFLHNISHEIRTPLNAIVGFSGFLRDPKISPEKHGKFADIIIQSSDQLLSIIDDIMKISTLEAGQEKVNLTEFELNSRLKFLYNQFLIKAGKQNIELKIKLSEPDAQFYITSDETKLTQVLNNLIGNAIKFTKHGHVYFGYLLKDNELEFFVEDTGIGIPAQMHEEIFKRFRQVETTVTRIYDGSGLGLSISKAYIELLGGRIWLNSKLGEGSTFYFTLPLNKHVNGLIIKEQITPEPFNINKAYKTLLIAEDEDYNFTYITELLSGTSFRLLRAINGAEAVEICKSNPNIDLVLMDIKMPLMDGYEATKQIRQFNSVIPIIAQTAYSTEADKNKALMAGCNDFLSKPFKQNVLISKIMEKLTGK
jgi:PAS domain S-box-containing protein